VTRVGLGESRGEMLEEVLALARQLPQLVFAEHPVLYSIGVTMVSGVFGG